MQTTFGATGRAFRIRHVPAVGTTTALLTALLIGVEQASAGSETSGSGNVQRATASAGGSPWQPAERLYPSGRVRDAALAGDTAVVAFRTGLWIRAAYRTPSGEWDVARLGRGHRPRAAVAADGSAVVAWTRRTGRDRLVRTSVRAYADASWDSTDVVTRRGLAPVVAIGSDGRIQLLALRWRPNTPRSTAVIAYTRGEDWSTGTRLSRTRLRLDPKLRNSLRVATTPRGRLVAAWRSGRFASMVFPGSLGEEPQTTAPGGKLEVSVSPGGDIWLATRFEVSEVEPGLVASESWAARGVVERIGLDVGTAGGAISWLVADNGPLWVGQQRNPVGWGRIFRVVRHAHGIGEATFVDPGTVIAVWRNGGGRLRLASHVGRQPWRTEGAIGRDVHTARLVSNQDDDALVTWSAGGAGKGIYAAARLGDATGAVTPLARCGGDSDRCADRL